MLDEQIEHAVDYFSKELTIVVAHGIPGIILKLQKLQTSCGSQDFVDLHLQLLTWLF